MSVTEPPEMVQLAAAARSIRQRAPNEAAAASAIQDDNKPRRLIADEVDASRA
jgi:hypothetical protein